MLCNVDTIQFSQLMQWQIVYWLPPTHLQHCMLLYIPCNECYVHRKSMCKHDNPTREFLLYCRWLVYCILFYDIFLHHRFKCNNTHYFIFHLSFQGKQRRSKIWYDYVQNFLLCLLGKEMPRSMLGRKYSILILIHV